MVPALLCTARDRGDTSAQIPVGRRRAGRRPVHDLPGAGRRRPPSSEALDQRSARQGRRARARGDVAAPVYTKQVEEILKRNIFCSACPPILGSRRTPSSRPPRRRCSARRCNLKLLAIMFAPPPADPRWSMAIIRDNDSKSAGPYNVGSKLRDATVDDIVEDRVYLDFGGGRREYLDLLDRPQPAPGAPAGGRAATPRIRSPPSWTRGQEAGRAQLRGAARRRSIRCWATWARSPRARASSPRPRRQARRVPSVQRPPRRPVREDRPAERRRRLGHQRPRDEQPRPGAARVHEAQNGESPLGRHRTQRTEDHQGLQHPMKRRTIERVAAVVAILLGASPLRAAVVTGPDGKRCPGQAGESASGAAGGRRRPRRPARRGRPSGRPRAARGQAGPSGRAAGAG